MREDFGDHQLILLDQHLRLIIQIPKETTTSSTLGDHPQRHNQLSSLYRPLFEVIDESDLTNKSQRNRSSSFNSPNKRKKHKAPAEDWVDRLYYPKPDFEKIFKHNQEKQGIYKNSNNQSKVSNQHQTEKHTRDSQNSNHEIKPLYDSPIRDGRMKISPQKRSATPAKHHHESHLCTDKTKPPVHCPYHCRSKSPTPTAKSLTPRGGGKKKISNLQLINNQNIQSYISKKNNLPYSNPSSQYNSARIQENFEITHKPHQPIYQENTSAQLRNRSTPPPAIT